jgi:CheY-like chemotaxis protein
MGTAPDASAPHVLLVDDDPLIQRSLARLLGRRGYRVTVAGDGDTCLGHLRGDASIAIVLLDLSLGDVSGEELLAQGLELRPELPFIILSGYVEDPSRLSRARAIASKPIQSDALIELVRQVLAGEPVG